MERAGRGLEREVDQKRERGGRDRERQRERGRKKERGQEAPFIVSQASLAVAR